ncbi:MAG: hypothetical protein ACTSO7_09740 [Candidatus Heimdallarchaeota archaeon]
MIKSIAKCSICGQVAARDELVLYNFPKGPQLVCRKCLNQLPRDPRKERLPQRRKPGDDIFPPLEY